MKVYEAVFNDELGQGVYGISLVENPAMEDEWIALSEQKAEIQFSAVDGKKNLLLGAVLIPNKKIYRNVDGHEFYITFTEQTIGQLAHDFIRKGNQNNSSAEHEVRLENVSFVESWQVEDPKVDKSALYSKQYEKGTWVTMAHVSDEIYQQVEDGTFKGFSVDAMLKLQPVKFKTEIEMNKEDSKGFDLVKELKTLLGLEKSVEIETPEVETPEVEIEVVDKSTEAMKDALVEVLAQFSKSQNEKIEALELKLIKDISEKEETIKNLKAELEKQPEVEPVVTKDKTGTKNNYLGLTAKTSKGRLYEFLNNRA